MDVKKIRLENLKSLIAEHSSAANLSKVTGVNEAYISQIINGAPLPSGNPRGVGDRMARTLENSCNKPYGWMDVRHKKSEPNATIVGTIEEWDDSTPLHEDDVEVPFFKDVELAAGISKTTVEDYNGFKLRFAKSALKKSGVTHANAVCVTVSGNSMEPVLPEGCTVGLDLGNTSIKDGKVYAIDHNGDLRVKQLYKLPNGGVRLRSYNRDEWDDEDLTAEQAEHVRIIGRVFWYSALM